MSISAKDMVVIAAALNCTKPTNGAGIPMSQWERDCLVIADTLECLNPRFDRARFLAACQGS